MQRMGRYTLHRTYFLLLSVLQSADTGCVWPPDHLLIRKTLRTEIRKYAVLTVLVCESLWLSLDRSSYLSCSPPRHTCSRPRRLLDILHSVWRWWGRRSASDPRQGRSTTIIHTTQNTRYITHARTHSADLNVLIKYHIYCTSATYNCSKFLKSLT